MKRLLAALLIIPTFAYADTLEVVKVEHNYITVTKVTDDCEEKKDRKMMNIGTFLGGLLGGWIGSAVVGASHDLAIGVGAAFGMLGGTEVQNEMTEDTVYVCKQEKVKEFLNYNVTLRQENGVQFIMPMDNAPKVGDVIQMINKKS